MGRRRATAALTVKGHGNGFLELKLDACGSRSVEVFLLVGSKTGGSVVQHRHKVGSVVRRLMRNLTIKAGGSRSKCCVIDVMATYSILKAYGLIQASSSCSFACWRGQWIWSLDPTWADSWRLRNLGRALCHYPQSAWLQAVSGLRLSLEAVAGIGVVTEGKSGIRALRGKESAKRFVDAGLMTGWYSAPHSLAAIGWRCRTKGPACEGAEGRPTCPAATARHRGRRAARALSATSRSRANGGGSLTAIAPHRAECRAGRTDSSACGGQQAVARGLARDGGAIRSRAPTGATRGAGAPKGWRDRCHGARRGRRMRRQGNTRQRAAPQFVAESERPARQGSDCPSQLSCSTTRPRPHARPRGRVSRSSRVRWRDVEVPSGARTP